MDTKAYDNYTMDKAGEKTLWKDCIFVFDTSSLLNFYQYTEDTISTLNKIFVKLKNRLWITDHTQFEFLKNRDTKIQEIIDKNYQELINKYSDPLKKHVEDIKKQISKISDKNTKILKHPQFNDTQIEDIKKQISRNEKSIKALIEAIQKHVNSNIKNFKKTTTFNKDYVIALINKHIEVGKKYSYQQIVKIIKEEGHRHLFSIPPGYSDVKDDKKKGIQKFGDIIIWKQIIDIAVETNSNVVFVCNDIKKGDWCVTDKNNNTYPLSDLIKEFNDEVNKRFWLYPLDTFFEHSGKVLKVTIPKKQIEEVKNYINSDSDIKVITYKCKKCDKVSKEVINIRELVALDIFLKHQKSNLPYNVKRNRTTSSNYVRHNVSDVMNYVKQVNIKCPNCLNLIQGILTIQLFRNFITGSEIRLDNNGELLFNTNNDTIDEDTWDKLCEDRYIDQMVSEWKDNR